MNILFISDVYFPRINGVSTSILTFRTRLIQAGHRVVLIAPDYHINDEDDDDIIRISSRKVIFDEEDRLMRASEIIKLTNKLERMNFDLIHIQTPFIAHHMGVHLSEALNVPRIESYHTFFEEYLYNYIPIIPRSWLRLVARRFTVKQCNNINHIIVPSTAMHEVLIDYGVTTETSVLPTSIELEQFKDGCGQSFKAKHGIKSERPVLIHVGRVAHEKNIDFLLRMLTYVWQEIPEVLLVIVGEGPAEKKLKKLSHNLGLSNNVKFLGYQDRSSELKDCYCSGDVFVFSSRTETQGLVLLEAMALGVPVISTAVMGTRDILKENHGALIAEEDERLFSKKVCKLLSNDILRKKLATEAPQYARMWSADMMANRLLELYQSLCYIQSESPKERPPECKAESHT